MSQRKRQKLDHSLIDEELISQYHTGSTASQPQSLQIPNFPQVQQPSHQHLNHRHHHQIHQVQVPVPVHQQHNETIDEQALAAAAAVVDYTNFDYQQNNSSTSSSNSTNTNHQQSQPQSSSNSNNTYNQYQPQHQQQQQQQQHIQHSQQVQVPVQIQQQQQYQLHQQQDQTLVAGHQETSDFLTTPMIEEQAFDNVNVLKEFVKEFGKKNEFGIAIAHSNAKAIYFTCELGGQYRVKKRSKKSDLAQQQEQLQSQQEYLQSKKIGSKKIRCPFAMVANFSKKKNFWTLRITEQKHNHPKLDPLVNFPMLRKRSNQVNGTIKELYIAGDKPALIHQKLSSMYPEVIIKREDIYNEIRILKKKGLVQTTHDVKNRKVTQEELMYGQHAQPTDSQSASYAQQVQQVQVQHHQQQLQQQANNAANDHSLVWASTAYQHLDVDKNQTVEAVAAAAQAVADQEDVNDSSKDQDPNNYYTHHLSDDVKADHFNIDERFYS